MPECCLSVWMSVLELFFACSLECCRVLFLLQEYRSRLSIFMRIPHHEMLAQKFIRGSL